MENSIQSTQPTTHAAEPEQTSENQNTETMNRDNQYLEQTDQLQQNTQQRNAE